MSNLAEIKERLNRLTELSNRMKEQFGKLTGAEGVGLKRKAKEQGTRVGIGAGVSVLGLGIAWVASLYILMVIILLVDLGLHKPWLSALIVVGAFLLIGVAVVAIGVGVAAPAAKELSKTADEATREMKQAGEEMKAEMAELQALVKKEAGERQKQVSEQAKVIAPAAAGAYVVLWLVKRHMKVRHERRNILRVIETYEESKAEGE